MQKPKNRSETVSTQRNSYVGNLMCGSFAGFARAELFEDVVVNLRTGRLRFAVARFDADWVRAGMLVALPLRPARKDADGTLAMRFGLNELNRAYLFEASHWPDLRDPRVRAIIDASVGRL